MYRQESRIRPIWATLKSKYLKPQYTITEITGMLLPCQGNVLLTTKKLSLTNSLLHTSSNVADTSVTWSTTILSDSAGWSTITLAVLRFLEAGPWSVSTSLSMLYLARKRTTLIRMLLSQHYRKEFNVFLFARAWNIILWAIFFTEEQRNFLNFFQM